MISEDLIRYVQNYLNQGYTPQQINQTLLSSGYNQFQINEVFQEIQRRKTQTVYQSYEAPQPIQTSTKKKFPIKFILIIIAIILIITISYFVITNLGNDQTITTTTTTITTTTTTTLPSNVQTSSDAEKTMELFEILLCRNLDTFYNCFESIDGKIKRGSSLFFYYRLFMHPHEIDGDFRKGFIQDRVVYDPNNEIVEKWSREKVLDVVRPVPDERRYTVPGYNELISSDDDLLGTYTVQFIIYDKFSPYFFSFNTTFELVE
ncbi:MAG: hypothetical protein ACMXX8_04060 [Candidatus Woesearchaeota archaeon]